MLENQSEFKDKSIINKNLIELDIFKEKEYFKIFHRIEQFQKLMGLSIDLRILELSENK